MGHQLIQRLRPFVGRLGIQCIIFDRTIWSRSSPNGTRYNGTHPHYDHIHIELTRFAAQALNLATIVAVVGGDSRAGLPVVPPPVPKPIPEPLPDDEDETMEYWYSIGGSSFFHADGLERTPITEDHFNFAVMSVREGKLKPEQVVTLGGRQGRSVALRHPLLKTQAQLNAGSQLRADQKGAAQERAERIAQL